ncbi:MAG: histidine phosphatase family protein [Sphingobacteriia bacterium]|nr:MAG: histidine phosphatase family protein [Sphingobacteriia bacterium]
MKTVLLVRHAKTEKQAWGQNDFDRQLTGKGIAQAKEMAAHLFQQKDCLPEHLLTSTAERAKATAQIFQTGLGLPPAALVAAPQLYMADPEIFSAALADLPKDWERVAVFAHNPGITDYANELTPTKIDHMPPGAVFVVRADVQLWKDFAQSPKQFIFFRPPVLVPDL